MSVESDRLKVAGLRGLATFVASRPCSYRPPQLAFASPNTSINTAKEKVVVHLNYDPSTTTNEDIDPSRLTVIIFPNQDGR
ncbi:hypothetical protein HYT59_00195 [Candidatus Woesebacteria bacterium]|nr:hypothetical protein [Candidatus Woesebacteria bacterium]